MEGRNRRKTLILLVLSLLLVGSGPTGDSGLQVKATNPPGPFTIPDPGCNPSGPSCTCSDPVRGIECGRGRSVCVQWNCGWYAIE